jgi:hypothetical protein
MKDTFIVNPRSIKESKESKAFIKEFVGDKPIISIDNKKYLLREVYLTYKIDSKKVYKQAVSLIFKTINIKTKDIDCPNDYTKFEIIVDETKYNLGNNSNNLVCDYPSIPIKTNNFLLIYYDNQIKRVVKFKEK